MLSLVLLLYNTIPVAYCSFIFPTDVYLVLSCCVQNTILSSSDAAENKMLQSCTHGTYIIV